MNLSRKPFDNLSVVDLGLGLSAALVTRMLADAGIEGRDFCGGHGCGRARHG